MSARAEQGRIAQLAKALRKHKALLDGWQVFPYQNETQKLQMEPQLGSQGAL